MNKFEEFATTRTLIQLYRQSGKRHRNDGLITFPSCLPLSRHSSTSAVNWICCGWSSLPKRKIGYLKRHATTNQEEHPLWTPRSGNMFAHRKKIAESTTAIKKLKAYLTSIGSTKQLVSKEGSQFISSAFKKLTNSWCIDYTTISYNNSKANMGR